MLLLLLVVFNQNYAKIMLVFQNYASFPEIMLSQCLFFYIVKEAKHVIVSNVV